MSDASATDLRAALADAEDAARSAYRDTARLIRLLTVIGTPSPPADLVERTLTVLSEVFDADVVCVAECVDDRLLVTSACGLSEDDPVYAGRWSPGPLAQSVLADGRPAAVDSVGPDDRPPTLRGGAGRAAAWITLSIPPDPTDELLILYRDQPFTNADLQILLSVGARMRSAVEALERGVAIERLAQSGPDLTRHLDVPSLLDDAAALLRDLIDAESAWIVSIEGDVARLAAGLDLTDDDIQSWPRPVAQLPLWEALRSGEAYVGPCGTPNATRRMMLCVPVMRDGIAIALLAASGPRARAFGKTAVEVATVLANYLSVAITNGELYRALVEGQRELRRRATHDVLTGLANRSLASQRIDEALATSPTGMVGLMFCDLDKFKEVNDRLGHEAGDELIQQVALRLGRAIGRRDLLARFGGDEFVLVLTAVRGLTDLTHVGRRIQLALADPVLLRGERIGVSASVGAVLGRRGEASSGVMLRDADAAMYEAKAKGPGRVEVFDDDASHRSMDRLDLRSDLPHALARGELSVVYQPIVALDSSVVQGFEALVRWTHPQRGAVPPDLFIPMAEETRSIVPIGAWVLQEACVRLAEWHRVDPSLTISVNLSARQLEYPDHDLLGIIRAAGVDPSDVWLEVTEHMDTAEDITEPVTALRKAGVHFALDDFGMSYSSMTYLQRFPVELLKIDKSFVSAMNENETQRGIVRAILAVAQSLSLRVVAEGIETQDQHDTLVALGCEYGQGYLLHRPMPAAECTRILGAGRDHTLA